MALPTTDEVCELLHDTLTGMVEGTTDPVDDPPDEVRPLRDKLLEKPSTMRDGMLTLLGYVVANADSIDFRAVGKFPGGRAVAQYVADDLLPGLNIAGKKDALQTGFKGVSRYIDRENPLTKPVLKGPRSRTTSNPSSRRSATSQRAWPTRRATCRPPAPGTRRPGRSGGRSAAGPRGSPRRGNGSGSSTLPRRVTERTQQSWRVGVLAPV